MTQAGKWPTLNFYYAADWLYHLPLIGETLKLTFIGPGESPDYYFLNSFADIEFNNMSGIYTIVYDLGVLGASVYFLSLGLVGGMLFRSMVRGGKVGGMLYPSVFVGYIEVMREPYLNSGRVVVLFVGSCLLISNMRVHTKTPTIPMTTPSSCNVLAQPLRGAR